jgi:hypothetical protein
MGLFYKLTGRNAYATGMDEDLNFTGDQYNILLTMFTVGTHLTSGSSLRLTSRNGPGYFPRYSHDGLV